MRETEESSHEDHAAKGWQRDAEFDADVDRSFGALEIEGVPVRPSDALWTDKAGYGEARLRWMESKRQELDERVCQEYPYPIAACYRDFLKGADHSIQRWGFLRDTWEAVISTLMVLILGELRAAGQVVEGRKVSRRWLDSWAMGDRISVIGECCAFAEGDLASTRLVSEKLIQQLTALNRWRNHYSHRGSLTEQQADALILECEPTVVSLLGALDAIRSFTLVRRRGAKFELFVGHDSRADVRALKLSKVQKLALAVADRPDTDVFALHAEEDLVFSLYPYVVYCAASAGRRSELACFKKRLQSGGFEFEVVGAADLFELSEPDLGRELTAFKAMFLSPGQKEKKTA